MARCGMAVSREAIEALPGEGVVGGQSVQA
jgi:hypothetical protein